MSEPARSTGMGASVTIEAWVERAVRRLICADCNRRRVCFRLVVQPLNDGQAWQPWACAECLGIRA